jgi:hypothetical protein
MFASEKLAFAYHDNKEKENNQTTNDHKKTKRNLE